MSTYNGHPSWNAWNVSLWINNDEGLYNLARECIRYNRGRTNAAAAMLAHLRECGIYETPDGARYSVSLIRRAMRGM